MTTNNGPVTRWRAGTTRTRPAVMILVVALVVVALATATTLATQKGFQERDDSRDYENGRAAYAIGRRRTYSDAQATVSIRT